MPETPFEYWGGIVTDEQREQILKLKAELEEMGVVVTMWETTIPDDLQTVLKLDDD